MQINYKKQGRNEKRCQANGQGLPDKDFIPLKLPDNINKKSLA